MSLRVQLVVFWIVWLAMWAAIGWGWWTFGHGWPRLTGLAAAAFGLGASVFTLVGLLLRWDAR